MPLEVTDPKNIRFDRANRSYSGCDIQAIINVGDTSFLLGNLQTLSYSIHRDKVPVRTLGRTYAKAYTRGQRTIAGTLIFTVFDRHVLEEIRKSYIFEQDNEADYQTSPMTDQLPPFDITITYTNEYGAASVLRIYGVEISDEGQTHSIEDMITENVMQYVARDMDLMVGDAAVYESFPQQGFGDQDVGGRMVQSRAFDYAMFNRDSKGDNFMARISKLQGDVFFFEEKMVNLGNAINTNELVIQDPSTTSVQNQRAINENKQFRLDIKTIRKRIAVLKKDLDRIKSRADSGGLSKVPNRNPASRSGSNSFYDNPFDPVGPNYKNVISPESLTL